MVVVVHLHTILQRKTDSGMIRTITIELPPGSSLVEVLYMLEIDFPVDGLLLVVNGKSATVNNRLIDGDIVHIIPAISGGRK